MASPSRRRANGAYERPGTMKTFDLDAKYEYR